MSTPLPIIRGTSQALYPFTQVLVCNTGIMAGQNGVTTRWVKSPPLVRFEFTHDVLSRSDKDTLKGAFNSAKGQFTTNLSATINGTSYVDLSFESDTFEAVESQSTRYGVKWSVSQVLPRNYSPGTSGGAYPALSTGASCQLPYVQKKRFQTIVSRVASGPKYTYSEFGGGVSGFPTGGLMSWEFRESRLNDSEVSAKMAHFLANWGDCLPFTFRDEDGTTYSSVYYGSPELRITYNAPNQASINTTLIQWG